MVSSAMAAVAVAFAVVVAATTSSAQLDPHFYDGLCPAALPTSKRSVEEAVAAEPRRGAALLRLHFLDCFGNVSKSNRHRSAWHEHVKILLIVFLIDRSVDMLVMIGNGWTYA